jgi:hypothetical protein
MFISLVFYNGNIYTGVFCDGTCQNAVLDVLLQKYAMEMKFLREIIGKTRRNRIRNDDIREQLKVDNIKIDIKKTD